MQNDAELSSIWQIVSEILHGHFNSETPYQLWFGRVRLAYLDAESAVFTCENETKRSILEKKYLSLLTDALAEAIGYEPTVEIRVDESLAPELTGDSSTVSPLRLARERRDDDSGIAGGADGGIDADTDMPTNTSTAKTPPSTSQTTSAAEQTRSGSRRSAAQGTEQFPLTSVSPSQAERKKGRGSGGGSTSTGTGTDTGAADISELSAMELAALSEAADAADETRGERRLTYNEDYTFENFIVGNSNRFAHAAALNVADNVGMKINPLFIYGPSGLGKTHLMYAIANRALKRKPDIRVIYVKGEEFLNQLVIAIQHGWTQSFRQKYRNADMLLIDDIQFIAGKEGTQMEFFHTFDALYEDHKQIILTSDRPPRELTSLEERIRSRFEAGLLADIQPPDYELRLAILQNKISQNNIDVPTDVVDFLARNLQENIRQLEGVIKKLAVTNLLNGQPVTMEMVIQTVPEYLRDAEPVSDTVNRIIECVAKRSGVRVEDILGSSRTKKIKNARNIAMYIVRSMTSMSLPQMGVVFCRDHSTIHSNVNAVETALSTDTILDATINDIIKEIKRG